MEIQKKFDKIDFSFSRDSAWNDKDKVVGVYFLILNNEIVYVGMSEDCYRRVKSHTLKSSNKKFDYANIIGLTSKEEALYVESFLIKTLTPFYNNRCSNHKEITGFDIYNRLDLFRADLNEIQNELENINNKLNE